LPTSPVDILLGDRALPKAKEMLAKDLGLINDDGSPKNFVSSYSQFLQKIVRNELQSYRSRRPAFDVVLERLPYTLSLSCAAILISVAIGIPLGLLAAYFRRSIWDILTMIFALLGVSIPRFWLGPLLLLAFAIYWPIFPISGSDNGFLSLVLPAISLGTAFAAVLARMTRACILEVLSEDYIRTAYAKGLGHRAVFFKHALSNAFIPLITIVGLQFGAILSGTIVIEKIFAWPGIGLLLFESITQLDMPQTQAIVLTIAIGYVLINWLVDILYEVFDPRIRVQSEEI